MMLALPDPHVYKHPAHVNNLPDTRVCMTTQQARTRRRKSPCWLAVSFLCLLLASLYSEFLAKFPGTIAFSPKLN